jgi:ceramide glucosyltransferase
VLLTGTLWSLFLFGITWVMRMVAVVGLDTGIERRLGREGERPSDAVGYAVTSPAWLLPVRDLLSVAILLASFAGRRVDWRGHDLIADTPPPSVRPNTASRPIEGSHQS